MSVSWADRLKNTLTVLCTVSGIKSAGSIDGNEYSYLLLLLFPSCFRVFCALLHLYVLLLKIQEFGPGLAEPFLPQELAYLGQVLAQVDPLLLPLAIAVGCNEFSTH